MNHVPRPFLLAALLVGALSPGRSQAQEEAPAPRAQPSPGDDRPQRVEPPIEEEDDAGAEAEQIEDEGNPRVTTPEVDPSTSRDGDAEVEPLTSSDEEAEVDSLTPADEEAWDRKRLLARDAKPLGLEEAISLATRRHPQLVAARGQTRAAEARVGQAQAPYYPRIDAALQYLRASENGAGTAFHAPPGLARVPASTRDGVRPYHSFNNFLVAVIVQQVIYDFGRTKGAVGAQRANVKAAKMNELLVEQVIVFGVMRAFYDVLAAREAVRVAEEALKTSRGIHELAQAGHDAGLRPPSEMARAEADVAAAEVALIRANLELDMARAGVANAVGAAGESFEPVDEGLGTPPAAPDEAQSIEAALHNRPELRALGFRKEGVSRTMDSVNARQRPSLHSLAGVNLRGQFLPDPGTQQDGYQQFNWNVGVVMNVPMFQGFLVRKQREELQAEMSALDGNLEAIRQAVILEVKQALVAVRAADEAVRASRKGVDAAKIALDTSQGRYRSGLSNLVEVVDAQAAYISAQSQVVRATYERHVARAILGLAMGLQPLNPATPPS